MGIKFGRLFISMIDNKLFTGIAFRIGVEEINDGDISVFDVVFQLGFLMVVVGFEL